MLFPITIDNMNLPLKIAIVEDEPLIAENIYRSLVALNYAPLPPVSNYTSAIELINTERPDLVLLDIRLSGSKDGVDLAAEIKSRFGVPFIYLTSDSDPITIGRAKKTYPAGYILKPFTKSDLYSVIEIAIEKDNFAKEKLAERKPELSDCIMIKHNRAMVKVPFEDILYIQSQHVYVQVNTIGGRSFLVRSAFQEYLTRFPSFIMRTHRSFAVNVHYIDAVFADYLLVKNIKVPLSSAFQKSVSDVFFTR